MSMRRWSSRLHAPWFQRLLHRTPVHSKGAQDTPGAQRMTRQEYAKTTKRSHRKNKESSRSRAIRSFAIKRESVKSCDETSCKSKSESKQTRVECASSAATVATNIQLPATSGIFADSHFDNIPSVVASRSNSPFSLGKIATLAAPSNASSSPSYTSRSSMDHSDGSLGDEITISYRRESLGPHTSVTRVHT
eukprot:g1398.t1